ncbi:unnamed protein product, partial [Prorocentrum cordatum]
GGGRVRMSPPMAPRGQFFMPSRFLTVPRPSEGPEGPSTVKSCRSDFFETPRAWGGGLAGVLRQLPDQGGRRGQAVCRHPVGPPRAAEALRDAEGGPLHAPLARHRERRILLPQRGRAPADCGGPGLHAPAPGGGHRAPGRSLQEQRRGSRGWRARRRVPPAGTGRPDSSARLCWRCEHLCEDSDFLCQAPGAPGQELGARAGPGGHENRKLQKGDTEEFPSSGSSFENYEEQRELGHRASRGNLGDAEAGCLDRLRRLLPSGRRHAADLKADGPRSDHHESGHVDQADQVGNLGGSADQKSGAGNHSEAGEKVGGQRAPQVHTTSFEEMFEVNATVMGCGKDAKIWMHDILKSFDDIVSNITNLHRFKEEIKVVALRMSKHPEAGAANLSQFRACMLAALRSLLPRVWTTSHEEAWCWLWDRVATSLRKNVASIPAHAQCLSRRREIGGQDETERYGFRRDIYTRFFEIAPEGQDFFKQSNTRLHFIADRILVMTIEIFHQPKTLLSEISALGLRHVGFGIPTHLFPPFVNACVHVMRSRTKDGSVNEAFRWSLSLISQILVRTINEGSTVVMQAINRNSVSQLKRAIAKEPRGRRFQSLLDVHVGEQHISPLEWAIESGSLRVAEAILRDLLTIRADRAKYYYGVDELFGRHPDIVKKISEEAMTLLMTLLDGLVWRSHRTSERPEGTMRRRVQLLPQARPRREGRRLFRFPAVDIRCRRPRVCLPPGHLQDPGHAVGRGRVQKLHHLQDVEHGRPDRVPHEPGGPRAALRAVGPGAVHGPRWQDIHLHHRHGQADHLPPGPHLDVVPRHDAQNHSGDRHGRKRLHRSRGDGRGPQAVQGHGRGGDTEGPARPPGRRRGGRAGRGAQGHREQGEKNTYNIISFALMLVLALMLPHEPLIWCLDSPTTQCPDADKIRHQYSVLAMMAMAVHWFILIDLAVFNTQISAFLLVIGQVTGEVKQFLMAICFLLLMFGSAISIMCRNCPTEGGNYDDMPNAIVTLFAITVSLYQGDFRQIDESPVLLLSVFTFLTVSVILLLNLLIAQINRSYEYIYKDMLGFARLNRASLIVDAMKAEQKKPKWHKYVASLKLDERVEFDEGDLGLAGCIQILEEAKLHRQLTESIHRYGGTSSPLEPWPEDKSELQLESNEENVSTASTR